MSVFFSILEYFMNLVVFDSVWWISINFRLLPVYFRFISDAFPVRFRSFFRLPVHFCSIFGHFWSFLVHFRSVFGSIFGLWFAVKATYIPPATSTAKQEIPSHSKKTCISAAKCEGMCGMWNSLILLDRASRLNPFFLWV